TEIGHLPNPRVESEEHYYNAKHQHLLDLGLEPHELADTLIQSVIGLVEHYRRRIRPGLIEPRVDWRRGGRTGGRATRTSPRRQLRALA
ncbi:MAG: hypothetical protein J2P43_12710, partial [Candidatus Dormibacteraeota bacterium]|nr:hypothetical protein [Candidatus Dormibacteraeota bacterium]